MLIKKSSVSAVTHDYRIYTPCHHAVSAIAGASQLVALSVEGFDPWGLKFSYTRTLFFA